MATQKLLHYNANDSYMTSPPVTFRCHKNVVFTIIGGTEKDNSRFSFKFFFNIQTKHN